MFLATALPVFLAVPPARGQLQRSFTENFSTRQYYNSNTTCNWDTVNGEIRLKNFQVDYQDNYDTPGEAMSVWVGNYCVNNARLAFVADGPNGLVIIDYHQPRSLQLHGQVDTPGDAWDVAVAGDYAYVGDSGGGLKVIDITDAYNPFIAGSADIAGLARGLAVAGNYVVCAWDNYGVRIFDVTDPTSPSLLATYATPDAAMDVALSGDLAFITARGAGLIVIDISDPSSPSYVGDYDTAGDCWGVAVDGDHAYLGDGLNGFLAVDVSDPANPVQVGSFDGDGGWRGVTVDGDFAYAAAYGRTWVMDISDPTSPQVVYSIYNLGVASVTAVEDEYLFIADGTASGLLVLRHQACAGPFSIGTANLPGYSRNLALHGNYAYVATMSGGLAVVDILDTENPSLVYSNNTYTSGAYAEDVAVSGDYLYLADSSSGAPGLYVFDIADPTLPQPVASRATGIGASNLTVAGDHLFLAMDYDSLLVLDITDPEAPVPWGSFYSQDSTIGSVEVAGDYAYLHSGSSEFFVLDVSNPAWPQQVGQLALPYPSGITSRGLVIAGDYAFLARGADGVYVLDVEDPTDPTLVSTCDTPNNAIDLALSGTRLFVTDNPGGVRIIDVSDPLWPELLDNPAGGASGAVCIAAAGANLVVGRSNTSRLSVMEAYQRTWDTAANEGSSATVATPDYDIVRAMVTASPQTGVTWKLSATDGSYYSPFYSGAGLYYYRIDNPGKKLRWRSIHTITQRGVNPTCSDLRIDWLYSFAMIDAVVDVPADQGGQVRVHFTRSGRDFADEATYPIAAYDIFRRIDDSKRAVKPAAAKEPVNGLKGLPPGSWEPVGHLPALQQQEYVCPVPTLADSAASLTYSVYCVVATTTTPSVYYVSLPDSGYSVDNLAPAAPAGFMVVYRANGNLLSWNACDGGDCQSFRVYRGTSPDFVPAPGNLVIETDQTLWIDPDGEWWEYHYKITALDGTGNESDPASPGQVVGVEPPGPELPDDFALYQNAPNPFNPVTSIAFELARPARATLEIFAVDGRRVARLLAANLPAGRHEAVWNGQDDLGRPVASGTYFYRLTTGTHAATKRLTLIK
jgi:hypothetical protein